MSYGALARTVFRDGGDGLQSFPSAAVDDVYRLCYSNLNRDERSVLALPTASTTLHSSTSQFCSVIFPGTIYLFILAILFAKSYLHIGRKALADKL